MYENLIIELLLAFLSGVFVGLLLGEHIARSVMDRRKR